MDSYDSLDHIHLTPYSCLFFFLNQLLCVLFLLTLPSDTISGKFQGLSLNCHCVRGWVSESGQPVIPCLLHTNCAFLCGGFNLVHH